MRENPSDKSDRTVIDSSDWSAELRVTVDHKTGHTSFWVNNASVSRDNYMSVLESLRYHRGG